MAIKTKLINNSILTKIAGIGKDIVVNSDFHKQKFNKLKTLLSQDEVDNRIFYDDESNIILSFIIYQIANDNVHILHLGVNTKGNKSKDYFYSEVTRTIDFVKNKLSKGQKLTVRVPEVELNLQLCLKQNNFLGKLQGNYIVFTFVKGK